jgi:hypothetical protein
MVGRVDQYCAAFFVAKTTPGLAEPATFQECRERAPRQLDAAEDQRETGLWSANTSTLLNAS